MPPVRQVEPGDYIYIRVFKRKNALDGHREGPFRVVAATPTAVKVEGRPHWYHLNHCSRGYGKGPLHQDPADEQPSSSGERPSTSGKTHPTRALSDPPSDTDSDSASEEARSPAQGTRAQIKCRALHEAHGPNLDSGDSSPSNDRPTAESDAQAEDTTDLRDGVSQFEELDAPCAGSDILSRLVQNLSDPAIQDPVFDTIDLQTL